jgi:hypothetical protein
LTRSSTILSVHFGLALRSRRPGPVRWGRGDQRCIGRARSHSQIKHCAGSKSIDPVGPALITGSTSGQGRRYDVGQHTPHSKQKFYPATPRLTAPSMPIRQRPATPAKRERAAVQGSSGSRRPANCQRGKRNQIRAQIRITPAEPDNGHKWHHPPNRITLLFTAHSEVNGAAVSRSVWLWPFPGAGCGKAGPHNHALQATGPSRSPFASLRVRTRPSA